VKKTARAEASAESPFTRWATVAIGTIEAMRPSIT
jgi:hypothetical protein